MPSARTTSSRSVWRFITITDGAIGTLPLGCAVVFDRLGDNPFFNGWGVTARILPYLEGQVQFNACNFSLANETPQNDTAMHISIATYLCPSDGEPGWVFFIDDGQPRNNTNYAFNRGDWYVWGVSASAPQPSSPFRANRCVPLAAVSDGLSNTLFAAEVKTHMPYLLNCSGLTYAPLGPQAMPGPNANPSSIAQSSQLRRVNGRAPAGFGPRRMGGRQHQPGRLHHRLDPQQGYPG